MQDNDQSAWMAAMRRGDFESAWAISDSILADRRARGAFDFTLPRHLQALWNGQPLTGKHVLVRCYHGLGDTIQFVRFTKALRKLAREVSIWVQPALMPLVARVAGVDRALPLHEGAPALDYDIDIEIMELAHALRVTPRVLARDVPYIRARRLNPILPNNAHLRVGLIWSAGDWDSRRSMRLLDLEPLMQMEEVELIVLQRGSARAEAKIYRLRDLGTDDIEEFAATLSAVDLLVSVDTFGAHLAAAMDVPVWLLLHSACDWRWMSEGTTSPWYPSMRLYRQHVTSDWRPAIAAIAHDLNRLMSSRKAAPGTNPTM